MYGKIIISCTLKVVTGLHIGGSGAYSPIGAVDSPVIKDPYSREPIIPGSSLKGKLRTVLSRSLAENNRRVDFDEDPEVILRLFGSAKPRPARLQFADAFISNSEKFESIRLSLTEVKTENAINRLTSVANPRQIERVIRGTEFAVRITYDMESQAEFVEDMRNVALAMKLLQLDYLGGHGTRGSGRVSFENIRLTPEHFDEEPDLTETNLMFAEIENYALLPV